MFGSLWYSPFQPVCAPIWRPVCQPVWQPAVVTVGSINNPSGPVQIGSIMNGMGQGKEVSTGNSVTSSLGDFSSSVVGLSVTVSGLAAQRPANDRPEQPSTSGGPAAVAQAPLPAAGAGFGLAATPSGLGVTG